MNFYTIAVVPGSMKKKEISFGAYDSYGREVGAIISRYKVVSKLKPKGSNGGWSFPLGEGEFFAVNVQMARDGERYGSGFHEKYFKNAVDGEKHIDSRLIGMKKRMIKKFGSS